MQGHECDWDGWVSTRSDCTCAEKYPAYGDPDCRCCQMSGTRRTLAGKCPTECDLDGARPNQRKAGGPMSKPTEQSDFHYLRRALDHPLAIMASFPLGIWIAAQLTGGMTT